MAKVWLDGKLVDQADAKVSVFDHGLLYGDGCFEGIRAYNGRVFKLASHLRRMYQSAEKIRLTPAYTPDEVARAIRETLAANNLRDGYIRLIFTRGAGTLGLHPFRCPRAGTIVIADKIQLYPDELYEKGMKVIVAQRPRIPIPCLDPAIKSLNYLNNILAKIEAIDADVLEAIMLNIDGHVAECTGDNIFIIKNKRILTPPKSAGILHGITREFVLDTVAPALGYAVEEKMMKLDEVLAADEVFLTGTAAEIIGVSQIDEYIIGNGRVGAITAALTQEFRKRVAANAPED
ncbi:MAG TPA: branched-chain-amino-acid transaminase [Phycisphaerales bacterium]|nr:branched-chain-amino-acid transaminase [Phycisphaerales bacterium]HRQ75391.1 branched-chain-amino-acid transaminase [Phycisphaerales bacterium]